MAAKTGLEMVGLGGEGKYLPADGKRLFRGPPRNTREYDLYVNKAAQAEGAIVLLYWPKAQSLAASDTLTLTFKAI